MDRYKLFAVCCVLAWLYSIVATSYKPQSRGEQAYRDMLSTLPNAQRQVIEARDRAAQDARDAARQDDDTDPFAHIRK
jgi:hypothetical protein